MRFGSKIQPKVIVGARIWRAGSGEWEDQGTWDPETGTWSRESTTGGTMRAKCVDCGSVNAISAHEDDEGEVRWGCVDCGTWQIIVPTTLEQRAATPKSGKKN